MLSALEIKLFKQGFKKIAGLDEVGRGCLAGPVAAAAVVLKKPVSDFRIRDSKSLSAKQREELFERIKKHPDIEWQVSFVQPQVIDKINISQATFLAFRRCLKKLKNKPEYVLIDGNQVVPKIKIKQQAIIKGDQKILAIALASVVAKVLRDRLMSKISKKYPNYLMAIHKGYGTKQHLWQIKKWKPTTMHRKSFRPVFNNLSFSEKVYYCVSKIPKGQVMTYQQVAVSVGHPKAYRAVGNVLQKNYNLNVPCHRVIRSDGSAGGYNRGVGQKRKMLGQEKAIHKCM